MSAPNIRNTRLAAIHADLAAFKDDCTTLPFNVSIAITRAMLAVEAVDTEISEHNAADT